MQFEVIRKMKVRSLGRVVLPGEIFESDPHRAQPYVERGFIKPVIASNFKKNDPVRWRSPVLGVCDSKVEGILEEDGRLVIDHPITKTWCLIPREWVVTLNSEEAD